MSKRIFLYADINDFDKIMSFCHLSAMSQNYQCYIVNHTLESFLVTQQNNIKSREELFNSSDYCEFTPCIARDRELLSALLYDNNNSDTFRIIKKYVKTHFIQTTEYNDMYIGESLLKKWREGKIIAEFPLLYDYFDIDTGIDIAFDKLIYCCTVNGFTVRNNYVKLRNYDTLNVDHDFFIIFEKESELVKKIINKNFLRVLDTSSCIYLEKRYKTEKAWYRAYIGENTIIKNKNLYAFFKKLMHAVIHD